jgi:hypothetical protein
MELIPPAVTAIQTFQSVRVTAAKFCSDRDWQKYHLPTNLALALSGECGELSEIFQVLFYNAIILDKPRK